MKKGTVNEIENISLSAKQIKTKLEDSLAYDHDKFKNIDILLSSKQKQTTKLPFSDYKISISEEIYGQQLLLEDIKKHIESTKLIEEIVEAEVAMQQTDEYEEEIHATGPSTYMDNNDIKATIIDEFCELDEAFEDDDEEEEEYEKEYAKLPYSERAKRPKGYTIKVVDVDAIIKKIKDEAIAKNVGKPVIGRREINKLLKPYIIKNNPGSGLDVDGIDESLTSIDIYLSAVDKINAIDLPADDKSNNSLELNLKEILEDLNNK